MYSITYNGENGETYGIVAARRPSVPAPEIRVTETEIPGMDGVLIENEESYGPITIPVEFNFLENEEDWMEKYRKAKRWLRGSGELKLGDDPDYFYKVYYCKITNVERTSRRLGNFTAEFTCHPYTFLQDGKQEYDYQEVLENPYMMSKPTYVIRGSGSCTLTVNGETMKATVNQNIWIDTERMIAYNAEKTNQSSLLSGNYAGLRLKEGENTITITPGFDLKVIPNWRAL